jgi:hypothetical protein
MESRKQGDLNKGKLLKVDLCSRSNAMNGKYTVGQLGFDGGFSRQDDCSS